MYAFLADLILVAHFLFVLFIVFGLVLIWLGYFLNLNFVRNPLFRVLHLLGMGFVLVLTFLDKWCPLTVWENQLRLKAGQDIRYQASCVAYWIHRVLYFELNPVAFKTIYGLFFLALLLSLIVVSPKRRERKHGG